MLRTSSIGQTQAGGGPSGCSFVKRAVQARGLKSPPSTTILQHTDHVRISSIWVSSSPFIEVTPEVVVADSAYTTTGKLVRCAVSGTQECSLFLDTFSEGRMNDYWWVSKQPLFGSLENTLPSELGHFGGFLGLTSMQRWFNNRCETRGQRSALDEYDQLEIIVPFGGFCM